MANILIVSSDFNLATMIEARLRLDGYDAFGAADGFLGFQKVQELRPQLIILDTTLSKMSGPQFIERIKGLSNFRLPPIIVISDQDWARRLFSMTDIFCFCLKPILCAEFMKKVSLAILSAETIKAIEPQGEASVPLSSRGQIVLGGVQEYILKKIEDFFISQGFTVEKILDHTPLLQVVEAMRPRYVFVQYWEDYEVFNSKKIAETLRENPQLRTIPFYIFCYRKIECKPLDFIPGEQLVSFDETRDLLPLLGKILSSTPGGS